MAHQIIRQPNGKLAMFDTVTDTIILWGATAAELADWEAQRAADRAREQTLRLAALVTEGKACDAYYQFAMTWGEALTKDQRHGGEAHREFTDDA